jgi:hypothetical protein
MWGWPWTNIHSDPIDDHVASKSVYTDIWAEPNIVGSHYTKTEIEITMI